MNLLPVSKLYPTLLALLSHTARLLARLLMQDKKSMRLNSNVSSQSNRSTELQAKLLPCYCSGKPTRLVNALNIAETSFSLEKVSEHLTSLLV